MVAGVAAGVVAYAMLPQQSRPPAANEQGTANNPAMQLITRDALFAIPLASTKHKPTAEPRLERAVFGAGCFWCVEDTFRRTPGVVATAVGYSGGHKHNPTYKEVCYTNTEHAEVVLVEYDANIIDYSGILDVFFQGHDPTQVDRQGPDIGRQYRSVIFTVDETQMAQATASKDRWDKSGKYSKPIATVIQPAPTFYLAEDYHQQYYEKKGWGG